MDINYFITVSSQRFPDILHYFSFLKNHHTKTKWCFQGIQVHFAGMPTKPCAFLMHFTKNAAAWPRGLTDRAKIFLWWF